MRISTSSSHQLSVTAMLDQQARLSKTQRQISTGERILTPADDPAGAARALDLTETLEINHQYQSSIQTARSRLEFEDSVLEGAGNVLQRLNELAIQGANATANASDRRAIEQEARQLLGTMMSLGNEKNANGEYLFSGFLSHTRPFVGDPNMGGFNYQGDNYQRALLVAPNQLVNDGDPGDAVFVIKPAGGGAPENVLNLIFNFAENMKNSAPDQRDIENIQLALSNVLDVRARVGARLNGLDMQENLNAKFITDTQAKLSETRDLDYAEAIGRFNLQQVALQAAQQAYAKVQGLSLLNYL